MTAAVRFDHVSKQYRRGHRRAYLRQTVPGRWGSRLGGEIYTALNDLSLELEQGESLGIVGHNGAGKSTLLKLVARVSAPTTGHVHINGRTAALIELGTGFHPEMTGRENISFSAAVLGMTRSELRDRMDRIIDFAGIDAFLDTPVKRYSSGMLARLGFAVAAHLDAEIVVIDEVLSVGDMPFQRKCHERIKELRSSGASVLYVTHALWSVPAVCTRAMLLERGNVVAEGTPNDVLTAYRQSSGASSSLFANADTSVSPPTLVPDVIDPDDGLEVSTIVTTPEPLPDAYVLISVHSADDVSQGATQLPLPDADRAGEHVVRFRLNRLPLQPGNYSVCVTLVRSAETPLVESFGRSELLVQGDVPTEAVFGHLALDVQPLPRR